MSPTVALLALLPVLTAAQPPLSAVLDVERIPLPAGAAAGVLTRSPFERTLTIRVARKDAPALAARLRKASRLCPEVSVAGDAVTLRCRSPRIRADLEPTRWPPTLDLRLLAVLPWRPVEEGPPLVPFDLPGLGLGACPGATPAAQGECLLAAGELDAARHAFEAALAEGPSPLASIRLGDLALRDDAPEAAIAHWRRARGEAPYGRIAQARLCELDAKCLASSEVDAVFDAHEVAWPLRADMVIRTTRLRALRGRLADVARTIAAESRPGLACDAAQAWCRRVLLLALRRPAPDGSAALAAYLEMPGRTEGPLALELARAAAAQSEAAGAPVYGANLLANVTGLVGERELGAHLLRTAELFLAGGDRARADEIARYARAHLGASLRGDRRWDAVARGVARRPAPAAEPVAGDTPDADLEAADAAVQASRLSRLSRGDRP